LRAADHEDRFRIFYPVTTAGEQIYVHAKAMIVDDILLHLGSSNLNNRSMGFDTECDIAFTEPARVIAGFQQRLLSKHLDVSEETFAQALQRHKSLVGAVEALNPSEGRRLCPIGKRPDSFTSHLLAETAFMDPRYTHDDVPFAGQGIRPRHLAGAAALGVIGYMLWRLLRR